MNNPGNKREHERLPSQEPAVLIMSGNRRWTGETRDMGMEGYLFVPDGPTDGLQQGEEGRIEVELFMDRTAALPCKVLHIGPRGIGLKIIRAYPSPIKG
ncbi:MAG: PilZ domain-containing protein [Magnetococcales bacterium]|nr:PilZ domain-containing protein [Magnetococcales bacterium]